MMDSVIQFEGTIYENGYGLLAQKVMRDKTLPKQSKLIYAYMCSFASVGKDGERTAFPSISLQCAELGMSEETYYKWRKHLVSKGYIKITKQRQEGARFDNNIYSIIAVPNEVKMDETIDTKGKKPYPRKPSTENPSMEKSSTNSNSFNNNSFNTIKDNDEDKRTSSKEEDSKKLNDEQLNLIINHLREATKEELIERSFKSVVKKVVLKYKQGEVNDFRNYLTTALLTRIEALELRRQSDKASQEIELSKAQRVQQLLANANKEPQRELPFYNWLEE